QLVTVVGPPGIGKTRLVSELRRSSVVEPEAEWLRGRVPPYGDGTALGALAQVVKRFAGILETDGAAQTAEKLTAAVRRLPAAGLEAASSHLRALVGLPGAAVISPDRSVESFAAWRALFEAIAATRPLVLVFEDLQWADDALLEFVDYLVDWASGHPILVVCTARPELLRRRPAWGGGTPNAVTLTLPPLSNAETAELLAALLDEDAAHVGVELRDQTAGNPLYAEQFARMIHEYGAGELAPPRTVQAVIGARIDILAPVEKQLLEDASVVGNAFWPGALAAVGGVTREDAELVLHRLEQNDLVLRRGSSLAGEREYAFRHGLVREVAYARVPRAYRVEKHRRAAEWLAGIGCGCDQAETLAHHYVCALEAARAAAAPTGDLERGARSALRAAGEHALGLGAFAAGERRLAAALELWPHDDPERFRLLLRLGCARVVTSTEGEAELLEARDGLAAAGDGEGAAEAATVLSELRWRRGDRAEAWRLLEYALALVRDAPDSPAKAFVLGRLSRQLMLSAAYEESISAGRQALALAERLGLDELRANTLNSIGSSRARSGDPGGMRDVEQAIAIGVEANSPVAEVAYNNLASLSDEAGDLRRADELLREARALAERFGDRGHLEWSDRELATRCYASGDWDRLVEFAERGPAETDGAPHYLDALVRCSHALVLQSRGETAAALRQASRGEKEARRIAEPQLLLACLADRAFVDLLAGRTEEASAYADEVLETAGRTGYLPSAASFELAAALVELGREDELVELLDALRQHNRWFDAARAYAGGDPANAADLYAEIGSSPAEAWARLRAAEALEDRDDAEAQRRRALAFYRSVGATIGAPTDTKDLLRS
ncbi:MAG TPA: AAA family ATPase, partial [Gaiellaceae bacterium]|nr:AAA family ATPase [Gaiellaceae bacterium]